MLLVFLSRFNLFGKFANLPNSIFDKNYFSFAYVPIRNKLFLFVILFFQIGQIPYWYKNCRNGAYSFVLQKKVHTSFKVLPVLDTIKNAFQKTNISFTHIFVNLQRFLYRFIVHNYSITQW